MMVTAGETRFPGLSHSELERQVDILRNNIAAIQLRLSSPNHLELRRALEATSRHFNLARPQSKHLATSRPLSEVDEALSEVNSLLDHLTHLKKEFEKLDQDSKHQWFLQGRTTAERSAYTTLYGYFADRDGGSTATHALSYIGHIYTWLYKAPFRVSSAAGADADAGARYSGPSVRFACAVLTELGLTEYFNVVEPNQLTNKIGDMWTNLQRRSNKESRNQSRDEAP